MTKFRFDASFKIKEIENLKTGFPIKTDELSNYIEVPDFAIGDIRTIVADAELVCFFSSNSWSVRHRL